MATAKPKKPTKSIVYDQKGRKAGDCWLPAEIFHARVNDRLLDQVVRSYAANRRQGNASTKKRKDVRGGGKKPWKQKGTGRARAGSIRAPHWKGGGVVWGPHPRDYFTHIPVQLKRQALISALSLKLREGKLTLIDQVKLEQPKTKEWAQILKSLKLDEQRTLCVLGSAGTDAKRAAKNMKYCLRLEEADACSAYDVMKNDRLLLEQNAISKLEIRLLGAAPESLTEESETKEKLNLA